MVEKIEINLIPQEYRVRTRRFTIKKDILIPIVISSILVVSMALWNSVLMGRISRENEETSRIVSEINARAHVKTELENLEKEQRAMETKIAGLKQISVVRDKWVRLFELYCREIPGNSWLTQLTESGSMISIKGQTTAFGEVGQFMVQLANNNIVSSVSLLEVKRAGAGNTMSFSINQGLAASMLSSTQSTGSTN